MAIVGSPSHRGLAPPCPSWNIQESSKLTEGTEERTEDPPVSQRAVSSPIQCRVERRRPSSPRSPPVVPPIPENEEEELSPMVADQEERLSFIKKLRRSSLTFRDSLRRRLSGGSLEEFRSRSKTEGKQRSGSPDYKDSRRSSSPDYVKEVVPGPSMVRRQSTIGVIIQSEFQGGCRERSSSGDNLLGRGSRAQGGRRASLSEHGGQGRGPGGKKREGKGQGAVRGQRSTYWKLPGVQEDDD